MKKLPGLYLLAAALPLMTIGGCAQLSGTPQLAVQIPSDCDRNAVPVPYPPVRHEDLGVRSARYAAALGQANGRLKAVRICDQKVREEFAKGR